MLDSCKMLHSAERISCSVARAFDACRFRAQLSLGFRFQRGGTGAMPTETTRGHQIVKKNKIKPQEQKRPEEWLQNPVGLSRVPITTQESQNMPVDDTDWLMHGQRIIRSVDAFLGKNIMTFDQYAAGLSTRGWAQPPHHRIFQRCLRNI